MVYCVKCGNENNKGSMYCSACGAHLKNKADNQRRSVFEGEIHKCPNCGGNINSFELCCMSCGYEIRGARGSAVVSELARKLEELEESRRYNNSGKQQKSFFQTFNINSQSINPVDKAKADCIMNFSIPNTKEDILEFMIMANSNIDSTIAAGMANGLGEEEYYAKKIVVDAWISKMNQAYQKGRVLFENDKDLQTINDIYTKKNKEINEKKSKKITILGAGLLGFIAIPIVFLALIIGVFGMVGGGKDKKLEHIVSEIEEDIECGDYDAALLKTNQLYYDRGWSSTKADMWDERREELVKIIEKMRNEDEDKKNKRKKDLIELIKKINE